MIKSVSSAAPEHPSTDRQACIWQVRAVPEEKGSAEALRLISDLLTADSILVVCGDTVTDVNLRVCPRHAFCFSDHKDQHLFCLA